MLKTRVRVVKQFLNSVIKCSYSTHTTFVIHPFKLHKLEAGPATKVTVSKEEALKMLKQMQMIRRLEAMAGNLYKEKYGRGFCHLYSGQEACAVGMVSAMRPQDCAINAYHVHGWIVLMGADEGAVLSEFTGRRGEVSRGKGGSMYMYARNFYGGNGIVGAQVPLDAGIAFACKYKQGGGVCLTLYGDGASNQGQVFEAYNMAKLWSLPCIFVCENNGYGMGTSSYRSSSSTAYSTRGDYIPGIQVDGTDVLAVREAIKFAIEHGTNEKGPVERNYNIQVKIQSYRYSCHSMSDPGTTYRTRDEIQAMRTTKVPILIFRNKLLTTNLATENEFKKIEKDVKNVTEAVAKAAREDKEIPVEEITTDVYSKKIGGKIKGIRPWEWWEHKNLAKPKNIE